ncbi:MAG: M3 family peptidase, partial [Gemmatimonadota bacterium]
MTETNPILLGRFRIPFDEIEAEHVQPGIERALQDAQARIDALSADTSEPTWQNTIEALDGTVEQLAERIAPVTHLMSVAETPPLREAYNAVLPQISAFWSRLPLDEALWQRIKGYAQTDEAKGLVGIRRRHLDKTVRDFERAGADLPP